VDGGATWTVIDMAAHATLLVDISFRDEQLRWVVGGKTWQNRLAGMEPPFPMGEWGWKIQFIDEDVWFASLEYFDDGAVLKRSTAVGAGCECR
jgi:hypothetical protein